MPSSIRSSTLCLLTLACVLGIGSPALGQQDDDRRDYLAGNGFLARGMDALAAEEYRSFLAQHPTHSDAPTARYGLAVALQRQGKNQEALDTIDGTPADTGFRFFDESQLVASNAEFALGRYGAAANRLTSLVDRVDRAIVEAAAPLLIESLHRDGRFDEAVRATSRIIERFRLDAVGQRGALFASLSAEQAGDDQLVIEWAGWAIEHGEDESLRSLAQLGVARASLRQGDVENAIRIGTRLAERGPERYRTEALNIMADSLRRAGRIEEADKVYARLEADSGNGEHDDGILIQRGVIAFEQGRYQQALRFFDRSDEGSEALARWSARCEMRLGQAGKAASRLSAITEPSPGAVYELAAALEQAGRYDDASAAYERFLGGPGGDAGSGSLVAHARLALASIDHNAQRHDRCADRCREILDDRSISDDAIRSSARLMLAESLYLGGDLEAAQAAFKQCLDSNNPGASKQTITYRLGMIHAQLGDSQTAEVVLRSVLRGESTPVEFAPGLRTLGDLAMAREDWTAAVTAYVAYERVHPGADDPAGMKLGIALARSNQYNRALDALDAAINGELSEPQLALAHLERGDVRQALGDSRGADEDWRRAIGDDSKGEIATVAGLRLSSQAIASGDTTEAERQLRAIIDTARDASARAAAMLDLGRLELQSGESTNAARTLGAIGIDELPARRRGEALACLSIACARAGDDLGARRADDHLAGIGAEVDPSLRTPLLYERAWRDRRNGDTASAIATYQNLLDLSPDANVATAATLELADLLLESGDPDAAIARLSTLVENGSPDDPAMADTALRLGALYYNRGDHSQAAQAFGLVLDQADEEDRSLDQHRLLYGESLHQLGLWASAVSMFEIAAGSDDPAIAEPALLRLGSDAAQLQRWATSESAYAQHTERFPGSERRITSLFGVGWAREAAGDPESAIDVYREAARGRGDTSARAQFQIGECLFALGRHEEAARELIKVDILYASPEWSAAALYEAGRCFDALGETEQAAAQWRRVAQSDGAGEWATMARARLGRLDKQTIAGESAPTEHPDDPDRID